MQSSFFQAIASALTTGQNVTIDVQGVANGQIKVIYTPNLGPTPEKATAEEVNLRAAIAKPMVVTGSAEEVEAAFAEHIKAKTAVVTRGLSMLDEVERLGAAAIGAAQAKVSKAAPAAVAQDDNEEEEEEEEEAGVAPTATAMAEPAKVAAGSIGDGF